MNNEYELVTKKFENWVNLVKSKCTEVNDSASVIIQVYRLKKLESLYGQIPGIIQNVCGIQKLVAAIDNRKDNFLYKIAVKREAALRIMFDDEVRTVLALTCSVPGEIVSQMTILAYEAKKSGALCVGMTHYLKSFIRIYSQDAFEDIWDAQKFQGYNVVDIVDLEQFIPKGNTDGKTVFKI